MTNHERFLRTPAKELIEKYPAWSAVLCTFVEEGRELCEKSGTVHPAICKKCIIGWLKKASTEGISNHRRLFSMSAVELALEIGVSGCVLIPKCMGKCSSHEDGSMCTFCIYNWLKSEEER